METAEGLLKEWVAMVHDENHKHFPVLFGKVQKFLKPKKRKYKTTQRGFSIYGELTDAYGNNVRVQMSSAASGPHCWIFAKNKNGKDGEFDQATQSWIGVSPHLSKPQAKKIIEFLTRFIEDAE